MNKKWTIQNIRYCSLPVTEKNPTLAFLACHGEKESPDFDMHFAFEIGIIISGKMKLLYKNWESELDAGKIWYCGIWEPHGWEVTVVPCRLLLFYIWPPMLFHLKFPEVPDFNWMAPFKVPPNQRPKFLPGGLKKLNELCEKIEKISSGSVYHPALRLRLQVIETLLDIQTSWESPSSSPSCSAIRGSDYVKIAKAVEMALTSHKFIPEKQAAAACGMSRNPFNKNFKNLMGISFSEFALCQRLSNASGEILGMNAPIKSISLDWGFTDTSHFVKCFRNHYMCTPAEYRKKNIISK